MLISRLPTAKQSFDLFVLGLNGIYRHWKNVGLSQNRGTSKMLGFLFAFRSNQLKHELVPSKRRHAHAFVNVRLNKNRYPQKEDMLICLTNPKILGTSKKRPAQVSFLGPQQMNINHPIWGVAELRLDVWESERPEQLWLRSSIRTGTGPGRPNRSIGPSDRPQLREGFIPQVGCNPQRKQTNKVKPFNLCFLAGAIGRECENEPRESISLLDMCLFACWCDK